MEHGKDIRKKIVRSGVAVAAAGLALVGVLNTNAGAGQNEVAKTTPAVSTSNGLARGEVDLISSNRHWQAAGVTQNNQHHELVVESTGLAIVQQDGAPGMVRIPENDYGTYLETHGAFTVTAELNNIHGSIALDMSGQPTGIQDEFLYHNDNLDERFVGNTFIATINDQQHGNNAEELKVNIPSGSKHTLMTTDEAGRLTFNLGGHNIGHSISDDGIFKTGNVWFGLDAFSSGGTFNVSKLTAKGDRSGTIGVGDSRNQNIHIDPNGFAAIADKKRPGFIVGTASSLAPEVSDKKYDQLLGNFNEISTENALKWQTVHPKEGNSPSDYNFSEGDAVISLAEKAGQIVNGHTLVFGEANPEWVLNIAKDHPEQLQQIMTDHITTVMKHYKGKIPMWDLIDEPLADYGAPAGVMGLRENIWYQAMGPQYLVAVFKAARAADPQAKLKINDFGTESDPARLQQMITLIKWLQSQGVRVDGFDAEAHIDQGDTNPADTNISVAMLENDFATLGQQTGVPEYISELDVSNTPQEYPVFGDVFKACISSANCKGVTLWGFTDRYGSGATLSPNGIFQPSTGRPWGYNYSASIAVNDIQTTLLNVAPQTSANTTDVRKKYAVAALGNKEKVTA